ncbi:SRPBCC family protein [Pseudomonas syringae]|uniref:XoxI n=1 Tax=Pseudomonas syringae TaxID=317 RepID=A0A085VBG7_PSESX|nr:SRPBCC family protein [Pseudomonas syringae]KFE52780.1 XoxI [Pseudomonas syringae]
MATASANIRVPVSADKVWQLVGGFLTLNDWLPMIASSESLEGGRVRKLTTADGAVIVERLQTYDNANRTYSYSIDTGPFPATNYLATLQVSAAGEQETVITWSGSFTPEGVSDAEVEALFQGVYDGGLEALKGNF